jgi:hypothetical protein
MIVQVGVTFGIQLMQTVQQVREGPAGLQGSYSQAYLAAAVIAGLCVVAAAGVRRSQRIEHAEPIEVEAELHGVPVPAASTLTD